MLPYSCLKLVPALLAISFLSLDSRLQARAQEVCSYFPDDGDLRKVEGRVAEPDSRPWIVFVWISCEDSKTAGRELASAEALRTCEGTLVRENWVVSAASCFPCGSAASVVVDVGLHSNDIREEMKDMRRVERIGVEKVLVAPRYTYSRHENDVALLRLSKAVKNASRAIELMDCNVTKSGADQREGAIGISSGWGATPSQSSLEPKPLHDAHVCLWPAEICERSAGSATSGMICAGAKEYPDFLAPNTTHRDPIGGPEPGRNLVEEADGIVPCFVEVGSPLVLGVARRSDGEKEKGACDWKLCGVLSFGMDCNNSAIPGFYTDICDHREWIETTIRTENGMSISHAYS